MSRLGTETDSYFLCVVANALVRKGDTLGDLGRNKEAIALYDDVVSRFKTEIEAMECEWVAKALVGKGVALGKLGREEEAIAIYDDVVQRLGAVDVVGTAESVKLLEAELHETIADALVSKGAALEQLGRREEAVAVYDDVIGRFGTAEEKGLRKAVENARHKRGVMLRQ
ncbi:MULTISPECIES: tetratricopeptide repeat protein [unclassified Bradyrhizobium]|uniref:tetratricopeptide repeat protein n=1 Tax=unclassified Bradyrhizobium TaxID=2631580 RepID=UPI0018DDF8F3|nr:MULTISPECIES: tetratricopeptide repeat protein [unclassified Bradyrhizobium]MCP3465797.1 tetratricopeptide repeat protein [Bradyrhizobium sp. CCGUVB23]